MNNNTVRYMIHKNVPAMEMRLEPPHSYYRFDQPFLSARIEFDHAHYLYLVDILERKPEHHSWAKLRIFMPDGKIATGWQTIYLLNLYIINSNGPHKGMSRDQNHLFDGRFNLTMEEATAISKKRSIMKRKEAIEQIDSSW